MNGRSPATAAMAILLIAVLPLILYLLVRANNSMARIESAVDTTRQVHTMASQYITITDPSGHVETVDVAGPTPSIEAAARMAKMIDEGDVKRSDPWISPNGNTIQVTTHRQPNENGTDHCDRHEKAVEVTQEAIPCD